MYGQYCTGIGELVEPLLGDLYYLNNSNVIGQWKEYLNDGNSSDGVLG